MQGNKQIAGEIENNGQVNHEIPSFKVPFMYAAQL